MKETYVAALRDVNKRAKVTLGNLRENLEKFQQRYNELYCKMSAEEARDSYQALKRMENEIVSGELIIEKTEALMDLLIVTSNYEHEGRIIERLEKVALDSSLPIDDLVDMVGVHIN